jgi:hypothetical protein
MASWTMQLLAAAFWNFCGLGLGKGYESADDWAALLLRDFILFNVILFSDLHLVK